MRRSAGWGAIGLLLAFGAATAAVGQEVVMAVVGPMTSDVAQYGIAANAYDAVGMVAQTIEEIGSAEREAIRDALAAKISWEIGYRGITGAIFFDEHGDSQKPIYMQEVRGGKWATAEKQPK